MIITSLQQISPKKHPKYSKNLLLWLQKRERSLTINGVRPPIERVLQSVYRDSGGVLWIGLHDATCKSADGHSWFHGAKMIRILCNGSKEQIYACHTKSHNMGELLIQPSFWYFYLRNGRCAIDREHAMDFFIGDKTRWKQQGDERHCLWCGNHRQKLVTFETVVTRKSWEPIVWAT